MLYRDSQLDITNRNWFAHDRSCNLLKSISVSNGHIRGVCPMYVPFAYPITAIVGENGAGKSTILALVSCAFHNTTDFQPQNRIRNHVKRPRFYYTYSDFFTFAPQEEGISDIEIKAEYATQSGTKTDTRKKKKSGKWTDYNRRPARAVSYLGINRIVPPSESSPHKQYVQNFAAEGILSDEQISQIKQALSKIFDRNYSGIDLLIYKTYRLFETERGRVSYTGFNMGAGENAVLGLLVEILLAGRGALIVVDEIELGLHAKAQRQLINVLKEWCNINHNQIVCSTHSKTVLDAIPPDGRIFIKRADGQTDILPGISSEFAFEKLSGERGLELDIFVEDEVGQAFLENTIPQTLRERINIIPVGSDQAILKHIAVHYREKKYSFIAFLDGDKHTQQNEEIEQIKKHLETRLDHSDEDFDSFMRARLYYLPGNEWPEKELVSSALRACTLDDIMEQWNFPDFHDLTSYLEQALSAGKHNEFYSLSQNTCLPLEQIRVDIIRRYKKDHPEEIEKLVSAIGALLS